MEHITAHEHDVRRQRNDLVDRPRERLRDVGLSLIDAARSEPLVLAEPQVQIGEVNEAQGVSGEGVERCIQSR